MWNLPCLVFSGIVITPTMAFSGKIVEYASGTLDLTKSKCSCLERPWHTASEVALKDVLGEGAWEQSLCGATCTCGHSEHQWEMPNPRPFSLPPTSCSGVSQTQRSVLEGTPHIWHWPCHQVLQQLMRIVASEVFLTLQGREPGCAQGSPLQ